MFNLKDIRNQFPILNQKVNGKPLVYLDNAATFNSLNFSFKFKRVSKNIIQKLMLMCIEGFIPLAK